MKINFTREIAYRNLFNSKAFILLMPCCLLQFVLCVNICVAQKETNHWNFGQGAALDFNSGAPVSVSSSQCSTSEGSSSISDTAGNLLFYTDGTTVWNKNNLQMYNGFGLTGNYSSSQSGLIVPLPGSDSLYYIFTVPEEATSPGLNYSVVDMSLQGGLGEVVIKNVPILSPCTEKVTAVHQPNGADYWIISHGWNSNSFFTYQLTDAGFNNTPVISSVGTTISSNTWNTIGYLKASSLGTKLAQAIWGDNYFELFDFDNNTGEVSNAITLPSYSGASSGAYGVEFSPDGSKLYGTVITPGYVYQWDMNAGSASAIIASKTLVGTSAVGFNGALQLATDGKIYMAEYGSYWLGIINDPDSLGADCNFVDQGFQIQWPYGFNGLGLPNNFPGFYAPPSNNPTSSIAVSNTEVCEKFCLSFFDSSSNNPTSWQWLFPGGVPSSSTDQNPSQVCYPIPGVYDVTLITSNANGTDTLTLAGYITVHATPPFPTVIQSGNTLTSSAAAAYRWQLNGVDIPGATNQSYDVQQSGYYAVWATDQNGCSSSTTIYILIEGIESTFSDADVSIYPNPSNGNFIVELSNCPIAGELMFKVYNTLGQRLFSSEEEIHNNHFSKAVDLGAVPPGIYFLELSSKVQPGKSEQAMLKKKLMIMF